MSIKKIFFKIKLFAISTFIAAPLFCMNIELENMEIPPNFEEVEIQQPQRRNYNMHSVDFSAGGSEDFAKKQVQPTSNSRTQDYSFNYDLPAEERSQFTKIQPKNERIKRLAKTIAKFIPTKKKGRQKIFNNFKLVNKTFYRKLYEHRINKIKLKNIAHKKNKPYSKKLDFSFLINMLETSGWLEINHNNIIRFFVWKSPYTGEQPDRRKKISTIQELKKAIEKHNKTRKIAIKKQKAEIQKQAQEQQKFEEEIEREHKREAARLKKEETQEAIQEFCSNLGKGCCYCLILPGACIFFSAAGTGKAVRCLVVSLNKSALALGDWVHEGCCTQGLLKIGDWIHEGCCVQGFLKIGDWIHEGCCVQGFLKIGDWIHEGCCVQGLLKVGDWIHESCCVQGLLKITNWCCGDDDNY